MADHALAATHDPRGLLGPGEAERRVRAALEGADVVEVVAAGPLTVGWTGGSSGVKERPVAGRPFLVVDGETPLDLGDHPGQWLAGLRRARGGFAAVACHRDRGLAARDHLGARPLFIGTDGSLVHIASELSPLLALLRRRPRPDHEALSLFLAGRSAPDGGTLFEGVRALPPAHALMLDRAGARLQRYWRPEPRPGVADVTEEEAAALLLEGVRQAVRRHGASSFGTGVLLSGGLDSSTVFACAAAQAHEEGVPVRPAFSAIFPDHPSLDEGAASRAVAEHWKAPWTPVAAGRGPLTPEGLEHIERWQVPLQHPTGIFFLPVVEEAARHGIRVLLDGQGGDELFGCEPLLLSDRLLAGDLRGASRLAQSLPGSGGRLTARQGRVVLRNCVLPGLLPPQVLQGLRRLRGRGTDVPDWLLASARDRAAAAASASDGEWWKAGRPRWRAHLSWVLSDGRAALGMHDHLRRVRYSAGVAGAHPFLDVDLAELVLGLPPELAFDSRFDRPLLRHSMDGLLPEAIRRRSDKVYFDALVLGALTGPDREAIDQTLRAPLELGVVVDPALVRGLWQNGPEKHPRGWRRWGGDVWRVFSAETWLRREAGRTR